jgi:hypothetical protein
MRVLAVIALAMLLAGCEGDRIKQSKYPPREQRAALLTDSGPDLLGVSGAADQRGAGANA